MSLLDDTLLARWHLLRARLTEARSAVDAPTVDARLYRRVGGALKTRIEETLTRVHNNVAALEGGYGSSASWATLHAREQESAILFGECLAFLQAGLARRAGTATGLCEIADLLLDEIVRSIDDIKWDRFTVFASDDYLHQLLQIIRLRFPACGIWDLPVAAHELGHFMAGMLNEAKPPAPRAPLFGPYKERFLRANPTLGKAWSFYLDEIFSDIFATYALGPAYAAACLLVRFNPALADKDYDEHPSYARRAHVILGTLGRMNAERDSQGHFGAARDRLATFWKDALESVSRATEVPNGKELEGCVAQIYADLKTSAPGARFNRWLTTLDLCPLLRGKNLEGAADSRFMTSDLLNAAWVCRMEKGTDPEDISRVVIDACRTRLASAVQ